MSSSPNLLNDDGTASIATAVMMSHHGFRRDLTRFATALQRIADGDLSKTEPIQEEWKSFHATLHGHHEAEDQGVFPSIAERHQSARATIERLTADHRRIDPLLELGNAAFVALPNTGAAIAVIGELKDLLDPHLATEERELIPFLRELKEFPLPPNEEALGMYAQGFAWSMHGIAQDVLDRVYAMLPENLLARMPSARAEFEARCERVWGSAKTGTARTPIPGPIDD